MLLAASLCSYAHAEGSFKAFYTRPEALSCAYWTRSRLANGATAREEESWALGFASGVALFWNKPNSNFDKMKNEDLFSAIDQRCKTMSKGGYLDDVILYIIHGVLTN
jgi:hypothetical protein